MTLTATPAVLLDGASTEKCVGAGGPTEIEFEVPVIAGVTVSVAVTF